jgi:hypothetical protein
MGMNDMSDQNRSTYTGGLGIAGLLTLLFAICKVTGYGQIAGWSWWWVLSPLWISWAIVLGVALLIFIIAGLIAVFGK